MKHQTKVVISCSLCLPFSVTEMCESGKFCCSPKSAEMIPFVGTVEGSLVHSSVGKTAVCLSTNLQGRARLPVTEVQVLG